jgi:serine/threonine protein kinase
MSELQSSQESPVQEGDVLAGKYRVEKVLGVGGMGVVVAAMHTELEERVALKFLLRSAAQNPAVVSRFSREARAAAKIKSQHVARVIDVGSLESGLPYIVMEYLEGLDLAELLTRDGPLSVGVAVDYVLQASEAIAEAHAAGFVHRDLKPANLFLAQQADGGSIVKVLDFGISKAVIADEPAAGKLTGTTDVFGSPQYMSPEQLKSSRDVDARADIWALGVILYELVTGSSPFDRNTVAETFGAILYAKPASLRVERPDVPPELDAVILRCLEKEASARLSNVAELAKAIFPFALNASRDSLDRTSRVLRRAGVPVASVAPPPGPPVSQEGAQDGAIPFSLAAPKLPAFPPSEAHTVARVSSGGQTRTAWDTASQAPRPRSGVPRAAGLVGGVLLLGGVGAAYAYLHSRHPPAPSVQADQGLAPPATTGIAVVPTVSTVTGVATAEPPVAPAVSHPVPGAKPPIASRPAPAARPVTTKPPGASPVKPTNEADDFGDRK